MNVWDRIWHGPVAAARPYLLVKSLMLLLAIDAWTTLVPRGALYDNPMINVAHFAWLDAVQPLPTTALYMSVVLAVGVLALVTALSGINRFIVALLLALFTYGWSMSVLDGYQHHYFLSLALLCVAFFPHTRSSETLQSDAYDSAWAFKLLGATLAVVYLYTTVAKLDPQWRGGETLRLINSEEDALGPLRELAGQFGFSEQQFWSTLANGTIVAEVIIAAGYLLVVWQCDRRRRWVSVLSLLVFVVAMSLHVGIELSGRKIGWFSYYMIALTCVYFLPAHWLALVDRLFAGLDRRFDKLARALTHSPRRIVATGIVGASLAAACSFMLDLPGSRSLAIAIAAAIVALSFIAALRRSTVDTRRLIVALSFAAPVMWLVITVSPARFEFYARRGIDLHQRGLLAEAQAAFDKAERYDMMMGDESRADLQLNIALALESQGELDQASDRLKRAIKLNDDLAEAHFNLARIYEQQNKADQVATAYERALEIDPEFAEAHVNLGVLLTRAEAYDRAERHFREATRTRPELADAHSNLGSLFLQQGDYARAIVSYQRAITADPYHADAHFNLGLVAVNLHPGEDEKYAKQLDDAIEHFRTVLSVQPNRAEAHLYLGIVYDLRNELDQAAQAYRRAIESKADFAEAHFNLAAILEAQDNLAEAAAHYQETIRLAPDFDDARDGLSRVRAILDGPN